MELAAFRSALDGWLDAHADELAPADTDPSSLDGHMQQLAKVKRRAFDAGFMRWGWPERVGGLGGSSILRAYLGEALTGRGLVVTGRVESGVGRVGLKVEVVRGGGVVASTKITGIEMFRKVMDTANPGDNVGLLIDGLSREQLSAGDVIQG